MQFIAENTLEALADIGCAPLNRYAESLRAACDAAPPPFGEAWYGDKFRRLTADPQWLARSLIVNADVEGDGARKLWRLAASTAAPDVADQIKRHALDESRHARLYIALLRLTFPGDVTEQALEDLKRLSPGFRPDDALPAVDQPIDEDHLLDHLIQMNMGEIRTRIHQLLLRPMIRAHAQAEQREPLAGVMDSLLADETKHIAYTARLIEAAAQGGRAERVQQLMAGRLEQFNELTLREVGADEFTGE